MSKYQSTYTGSYAVVVGIDQYADPRFMPLGEAEADAQAVAEVLASAPYHFDVTSLLGKQATRAAVIRALADLRTTQPDDRIVFFFAGHGYTLPDTLGSEVGYLACSDTVPDDPYAGLEFEEATKIRRWAKAKHIAFILDACFSGKALGLTRAAVPVKAAEEYMLRRAWQVLTAGGDEVVSDARSMTDVLAQALREGIPGESGPLTFSHLGGYVKDTVTARSKGMQIPVCQYLEGSSNGEMVLLTSSPLKALPEDLRSALTDENPVLRRYAIAEAEKRLGDPQYGAAVRAVLEDMQYDDPDREVRRRAGEALRSVPIAPHGPGISDSIGRYEIVDVISPQQPAALPQTPQDRIRDILPAPFEWCEIPGKQGFSLETDDGNKGTYNISPFFMAKYQTTYEQFQVFIDAADGFHNDEWWRGLAKRESEPGSQYFTHAQDLPRENVSWFDAVAFCRWLSSKLGYEVRLPTEWEWQWAAQGPDGRVYPWGNEYIKGYANIDEKNSGIDSGVHPEKTAPVGSYPEGASPYGILDMSGNVWEWCLNEYDNPSQVDTTGAARRVLRGGSWFNDGTRSWAACRGGADPNDRGGSGGFRVVGFVPVLK